MPISQSRLKTLADCAEACATKYRDCTREIAGILAQATAEDWAMPRLLAEIAPLCAGVEIDLAPQLAIIQREQLHYKYTHKANESEKLRQRRRRAEAEAGLARGALSPRAKPGLAAKTTPTPTYPEDFVPFNEADFAPAPSPLKPSALKASPDLNAGLNNEDFLAELRELRELRDENGTKLV